MPKPLQIRVASFPTAEDGLTYHLLAVFICVCADREKAEASPTAATTILILPNLD